jgi:hypothetical protein
MCLTSCLAELDMYMSVLGVCFEQACQLPPVQRKGTLLLAPCLHVSHAFLYCRAIVTAEKALLFEPNSPATRRFVDTMVPHLESKVGAQHEPTHVRALIHTYTLTNTHTLTHIETNTHTHGRWSTVSLAASVREGPLCPPRTWPRKRRWCR